MELAVLTPQSVQAEIRKTRHKAERPLYIILSLAGFLTILMYIINASNGTIFSEFAEMIEESGMGSGEVDISYLTQFLIIALTLMNGIVIIIFFIARIIIEFYRYYGKELAYGVRVSEKNFPEIYEKVKEYTGLLGMKKEPEVFVKQENGTVNAFTSWVPGRGCYIQLNAEIVDLAYMEHKDFDTIYFVMAHEFGHIYLRHVQMYYNLFIYFLSFIPIIGPGFLSPMLQRAREYSADRVAQALTDGVGQEDCMMLLSAGRHIYRHISSTAYLQDIIAKQGPLTRFSRWLINAASSHPIAPFRVKAILDPRKKSGRIF